MFSGDSLAARSSVATDSLNLYCMEYATPRQYAAANESSRFHCAIERSNSPAASSMRTSWVSSRPFSGSMAIARRSGGIPSRKSGRL